jgi:ribonuclease HII
MKILGIDEAGRGPVCGPMMICGYLIDEKNVKQLRDLKVKDSKMLSAEQRTIMAPKLKKMAEDYIVLKVTPKEIDNLRDISNLNRIEISKMQEIIRLLKPDRVIIDSPEVNTKKFNEKIKNGMRREFQLVSENFADKNHPEVSAASVLAKVYRDMEIEKLHEKYGFFGSGYPSDERTVAFLKNWFKMNKGFPDFVRKSWLTAVLIKEEHEQSGLKEFVKDEN